MTQVNYETVRRLAHLLPNVEDGSSYGTPALKVRGKLFVRLREDIDSIVLRMPFDKRDDLISDDPETYYITDHYRDYPWVLVRLSNVTEDTLHELLQIAHRAANPTNNSTRRSQ
jgi:hypothetical protein